MILRHQFCNDQGTARSDLTSTRRNGSCHKMVTLPIGKFQGEMVKGMGGAMDLVASAENIIVAMMHTNKRGESKILKECSLPLTGVSCVKKIITNLAVLEVTDKGFKLLERAPSVSVEEIKNATEGTLIIEGDIPEMNL